MRKGYECRALTNFDQLQESGRVLDLRDQIRELQLQSALAADRDEEASYFVIPGKWTISEFRELLATAA